MSATLSAVDGHIAWRGPDMKDRLDGVHVLADRHLGEIDKALQHLKSLQDIDLPEINTSNFPLSDLGDFLREQQRDLRDGLGFLLLRGLSPDRYADDDMARIYFGLGAYLGSPLPQSYLGDLLGHVIDVSDVEEKPRTYHAGGGLEMHTDSCDIVALLCLRGARSGGASRIVSVATIHNVLLDESPELLEALYGTYIFRRTSIDAEHGAGVTTRPISIFSRDTGALSCYLSATYPRRAVAMGDAVMSPIQLEALAAIERIASSSDYYFDMNIRPGDIQFLNNRVLLHGRTDYQDHQELARRRHMMRLWLELPSWPAMPAAQVMHTRDDHALWLRRRRRLMELPSNYLAELSRRPKVISH